MKIYLVSLHDGHNLVAQWEGPASSEDAAVAKARAAHPGTDHHDADVETVAEFAS
ncbi:hypothetical protein SEA_LILMAC1015_50 [Arthrobacter phage Lilmac1015]|uniref:Uncharacterized protein n=1 Tax=Arthrobacter phage Lilmac1015 TaxID=2912653 RepID=A0AA49GYY6_9CAUD|nr:hypothetical protein SEA_LILMAC1015_50 [Arthrobacter phage Lilmac1015]